MVKIADKIKILNDVKTDFVLDQNGNPTDETYDYKEYQILDQDGVVLETGRYTSESITEAEILQSTGIRLGISKWVI